MMMTETMTRPTTESSFKESLDGYYDWPCGYLFKFIAPRQQLDALIAVFDDQAPIRTRDSRRGNYVSVTAELTMPDSDSVVDIYRRAAEIEGVLPL